MGIDQRRMREVHLVVLRLVAATAATIVNGQEIETLDTASLIQLGEYTTIALDDIKEKSHAEKQVEKARELVANGGKRPSAPSPPTAKIPKGVIKKEVPLPQKPPARGKSAAQKKVEKARRLVANDGKKSKKIATGIPKISPAEAQKRAQAKIDKAFAKKDTKKGVKKVKTIVKKHTKKAYASAGGCADEAGFTGMCNVLRKSHCHRPAMKWKCRKSCNACGKIDVPVPSTGTKKASKKKKARKKARKKATRQAGKAQGVEDASNIKNEHEAKRKAREKQRKVDVKKAVAAKKAKYDKQNKKAIADMTKMVKAADKDTKKELKKKPYSSSSAKGAKTYGSSANLFMDTFLNRSGPYTIDAFIDVPPQVPRAPAQSMVGA